MHNYIPRFLHDNRHKFKRLSFMGMGKTFSGIIVNPTLNIFVKEIQY